MGSGFESLAVYKSVTNWPLPLRGQGPVTICSSFDPETGTNADDEPDYNFDILAGLHCSIDISQPLGKRITGLTYPDGNPVGDEDSFVMTLNNYRASGGDGFPHVADAKVVYNEQREIRQALIEWASARGVSDPADFFVQNWKLNTAPLPEGPTPSTSEGPTAAEGPTPSEGPTATEGPTPSEGPTPTDGPTTTQPAPTTSAPSYGPKPGLPHTGAPGDPGSPAAVAMIVLLLAGTGAVMVSRSRRAGMSVDRG